MDVLGKIILLPLFKLLVDDIRKISEIPILDSPAVHEKCRNAFYIQCLSLFIFHIDFPQYGGIMPVLVELGLVQSQLLGDFNKFLVAKASVVFKQLVMVFPEFTLAISGKSCRCRLFGVLVTAQRKILVNHFYRFRVLLEQLLKLRREPGTVRSLKIAEYSENHRCILRALGWRICRVDFNKKIK